MKPKRSIAILLVTMLALTGCGGGGSGNAEPGNEAAPLAGVSSTGIHHYGIDSDARRDYRRAMYDDCVTESGRSNCSLSGRGWFYRWNQLPKVHISANTAREGTWAIRRTIGILNRSLPEEYRLSYETTNRTFSGVDRDDRTSRVESLVPRGVIHAEIYPYDDPKSGGSAWTDGKRSFALGDESGRDLSTPHGMRLMVETMVHEFLHALGLVAHPQEIHTSIMSYRYHSEGEIDRVPLIDVAMLHDLYGWGFWDGEMRRVTEHEGGVHFGVDNLHRGTAVIPWVDASYLAAPRPNELSGSASYDGTLVGYAANGTALYGDADLSVHFGRGTGVARFHRITDWDGNSWNRSGYRYDLSLYGHYFDSTIDSQDRDGIPDVVGAFYGFEAETAAGTLQRSEITAAFGAVK